MGTLVLPILYCSSYKKRSGGMGTLVLPILYCSSYKKGVGVWVTLVLPILYCSSYKKGVEVWVHWYFLYCIAPLIKKEWGYGYTGTSYIVLLLL